MWVYICLHLDLSAFRLKKHSPEARLCSASVGFTWRQRMKPGDVGDQQPHTPQPATI